MAVRDRRWAQGNLQHTKIIGADGLSTISRGHFFIGIMSYLSSPLWLMLLVVGFALTLQATLIRPEYFSRSFQLFPDWPKFDAARMMQLFIFTMVVLFMPKVLGMLRSMFNSKIRKGCGGFLGVIVSTVFETLLSALVRTHHDAGADPACHRNLDRAATRAGMHNVDAPTPPRGASRHAFIGCTSRSACSPASSRI